MKESVITTLPMDPKRAQEFFLFTTPFIAHLIAKATDRGLYLPINKVGEAKEVRIFPYVQGLNCLNISPYTISYDNEPAFLEWMKERVHTKYKSGELSLEQKAIVRCPCGAVEILLDATDKIEKRTNAKTFSITSTGNIECRKCKEAATHHSESVLLTTPKEFREDRIKVQPKQYISIVADYLKNFVKKPQLISRARSTTIQIDINGYPVNIDNDYVWLHFGQYLQSKNLSINGIVVSNHSVRKGAMYTYFTGEQEESPNIILFAAPYISFKEKSHELEMDTLAEKYNPKTLRAFLLTHLNWQVQNSFADPNLLRWSIKVIRNLPNPTEVRVANLDNIVNLIKGHAFKKLVQTISKGEELTYEQKALLFILEPENQHF